MKRILVAGASGYLGKYILKELETWQIPGVALVRNPNKLKDIELDNIDIVKAEVTKAETLQGICEGVDTVISTLGITRQQDGLNYMEVDFQANMNLLTEAVRSGVKKFVYISVINGDKLCHLKVTEAKEKFVEELRTSGLDYTVIRPNGFFSDMKDFLMMAEAGRVFLFGDGEYKLNPIHGADLAEVCVRAVAQREKEIIVGGPDLLTQNEIAELAFNALGKPVKTTHLPRWTGVFLIKMVRIMLPQKRYGPIEFFLTLLLRDNIGTRHGSNRLQDFFRKETQQQSKK